MQVHQSHILSPDMLTKWLSNQITRNKKYTHRLLKENLDGREHILSELTAYVQYAHADAKQWLHRTLGIEDTLDPFGETSTSNLAELYPTHLPLMTLQGYFGEIFAAIVAEYLSPCDEDGWAVPAFLFRFHNEAFHTLERMTQKGQQSTKIIGRTGDDQLAFLRGADGKVVKYLYCEAKCLSQHHSAKTREAHEKVSGDIPVDVVQLIDILQQKYGQHKDEETKQWIDSLQNFRLRLHEKRSSGFERCDMVVYIGDHPKKETTIWLPTDRPHTAYTAKRRLEAVEVHLHDVQALVGHVYGKDMDGELGKAQDTTVKQEALRPSEETQALARQVRESSVQSDLTPELARLYSHHTKLQYNQTGLPSWSDEEAQARLDEACRLIDAALIERDAAQNNDWIQGMRRAGNLLEWLAHPSVVPEHIPAHLLAAAAYQLAGYPALAMGLLGKRATQTAESHVLRAFLQADFPQLFEELTAYWARATSETATEEFADRLHERIVKETTAALGILCAEMRWGGQSRFEKALEQLVAVREVFLHGDNSYSWLLAKLCAAVAGVYSANAMRHHLSRTHFTNTLGSDGQQALEIYLRLGYQSRRSLAWASQVEGIQSLVEKNSFALCTPTGSGKTTIAELAILQGLFAPRSDNQDDPEPLAIYLVPSRALAAEVEAKLSRTFWPLGSARAITVTGLYGGTDWGPTDAWLTRNEPTVLICTYEKGEALLRFLGPLFLNRVSLVVIDEAHKVQFDKGDSALRKGENRSMRLEALGMRLLTLAEQSRVVALSAVAGQAELALAQWVTGQNDATPVKTSYRSTRQMIGRLECHPHRETKIRYDTKSG